MKENKKPIWFSTIFFITEKIFTLNLFTPIADCRAFVQNMRSSWFLIIMTQYLYLYCIRNTQNREIYKQRIGLKWLNNSFIIKNVSSSTTHK